MKNTELHPEVTPHRDRHNSRDGLIFVLAMWFLSRSVIAIGMQLIAPLVCKKSPVYAIEPPLGFVSGFLPKSGWELFSHWDGKWYIEIATLGYSYADDGQHHSVAFYPLFPLLVRGLITLGIQVEVAGVLINSLAFMGALVLVYFWVEQRYDTGAAKWTTAVLAWCPFSLFCTVIYTEGLFLFLTASALRAFERGEYIWAGFWGALTTATRGPEVALIPTFLLTAWREKRPPIAYAAGLASAIGLLSFSLYCGLTFGDALAFIHVQKAWVQPTWLDIFRDFFSFRVQAVSKVGMIFGGGYLLWYLRKKLSITLISFGFCSLALLLNSGALQSVHRYAYGILSLSIALGLLLSSQRRWGYAVMTLFPTFLLYMAVKFAAWA
ncbi:mannosyltransferase family protein [Microcoleus sp. bin38.metabat.b11b12b14.051]|uniref:mannosyltransferase family protein n=1 Tax=Microcoleus sp. bin38.metabat.b11b12b14.051 TaxID=2742709 RepID=UPI0025EE3BE0|nr:mannosyltransferase family protein [Microcoleus sp. bin38.metabat.b11b12b14.051]